MDVSLSQLRRDLTQRALRLAIAATARVSIDHQRRTVASLTRLLGETPTLRRRVRTNMLLALGDDVPPEAEISYFNRVGWFLGNALSVFHHGPKAWAAFDEIKSDESIGVLDAAVAEGRGAVIVSPHWCGHELIAAQINRRYPMAFLVRRASSSEGMERKLKWYKALGAEIILRPNHASTVKDAVIYLNVLKRGKVLAITPDLLTEAPQGVETQVFGRRARLHGGAFAIANAARTPMIRPHVTWRPDSSLLVSWDRAPDPPADCDRATANRLALENWLVWFEQKLRSSPENWLFWLDKRWSRFLRATSRDQR
jgi:lauroyl/myristoyl acyltransferase